MGLKDRWSKSTLGRSSNVLTRRDKKLLGIVTLIQIFLGFLDLAAISALGVLGALAISGTESRGPGTRVSFFLHALHINKYVFQTQVSILGAIAAGLLISRTVLSVTFSRRILYFLSRRGAVISSRLVAALLSQPLLFLQKRTNQEIIYGLTYGVNSVTLGVIGTGVNLVADSSLLFIISIGLFVVDPTIAISSFIIFGTIAYLLYKLLHKRAAKLGNKEAQLTIYSNEKILEVLNSYREAVVRDRRDFYAREISKTRLELADTLAELSFMPLIGKYVIESSVVLGALALSAVQFVEKDAVHAVATLTVFMAAGTRIAPAILRIQQSLIQLKGGLGTAKPTLDLIESVNLNYEFDPVIDAVDTSHASFSSHIEIKGLSFAYSTSSPFALNNLNLEIYPGEFVAIVGSSGAGKTTLVDLLLGIIEPSTGEILISGLSPRDAVKKWPGAIGYVPQNSNISNGTIKQNVGLGYLDEYIENSTLDYALQISQLEDFVKELPNGVNSSVGEAGNKLSGGQRQRLGIARAVFTQPQILVLDEATSALDGETEANITKSVEDLKGRTTIIMIAHRLSTIRNADKVVYMKNGLIVKVGKFDEVRSSVPEFDKQASLMGL